MPHDRTRATVLGLPIDAVTMDSAIAACTDAIDGHGSLMIGVLNAAKVVAAQRDAELREALHACDLVLADGQGVVWAARLLGTPVPERIAGIDLFFALLDESERRGDPVYLLGATDEVLEAAVARVRTRWPRLQLAGHRNGYFDDQEAGQVAREVAAARPHLLFVAMSTPKKERFLGGWAREMAVPVCHGVGGSFDVLAGKTRRAPRRWQRLGLEWLYRLLQEPRRMWRRYLPTNTRFVALVARGVWERLRRGAQGA